MMRPTLFLFAGLPGTGKTTLARGLAQYLGAAYLRVDTIEQGLRDLCGVAVQGEGYRLAYRIAAENLRLGLGVVADQCNPITLTRDEWEAVAAGAEAPCHHIEVICSDPVEHRRRVETRVSDIEGMQLPDWAAVQARHYDAWDRPRLIVDTAQVSAEVSLQQLLALLECL